MRSLQLTQAPVAQAEMLIRKSVADVFEAFVNPDITTEFWFTQSSGRLEAGKQIQGTWEMFDASAQVNVLAIEANQRILIEWGEPSDMTQAEWIFTPRTDGTTFVRVTNSGFQGDGDEVVAQALDAAQGFSIVLAGAKAFLEHGIRLNLVADKFPDKIESR